MKRIFLYGAPGTGKTTLGMRIAEAVRSPFLDLDAFIVEREGREISKIFATDGEAGFRKIESAALEEVVGGSAAQVVALGGGTLLDAANRDKCEAAGSVICLDAPSSEELERRLGKTPGVRPLGDRSVERAEHYISFPNRIAASFDLGDSVVLVGRSLAAPFVHGEHCFGRIDGEEKKTLRSIEGLWKQFAMAGIGRRDRVVAIGGGVTGDLVGFAAATWMRGIDWIDVPTTLLAMVDASVGGKTGFDLEEGKNLVGAFHPPRLVVIDTDYLKTLPEREIANGRAEMVKHEIIGAKRSGKGDGWDKAIAESLAVKVGIVREDPFETSGRRILLNCGHTVGHAVEKASGYRIAHGEAVAIGCVAEARLAVNAGLASEDWSEELAKRFAEFGLNTAIPETMSFDSLRPIMRGDKKHDGDEVEFALPCGWGNVKRVRLKV